MKCVGKFSGEGVNTNTNNIGMIEYDWVRMPSVQGYSN